MPTIFPAPDPLTVSPRLTRNTVALLTVDTSIGPLKGMESRGCVLNPSRVLITSMSAQSDGRVAQFGFGRLTRMPVL